MTITSTSDDKIVAAALALTNANRERDRAHEQARRAAYVADAAHKSAAIEQANFNEARDYAARMADLAKEALQAFNALNAKGE